MTREEWGDRISKVADGLYVGEVAVRAHAAWLEELGIDNVVSILTDEQRAQWDAIHPVPPQFKHATFDFSDHQSMAATEIDKILGAITGTTLLHCISGANRSTAIAICWLIKSGMETAAAFNHYYCTRGMSTAKVYGVPPRMSPQMVENVCGWIPGNGTDRP